MSTLEDVGSTPAAGRVPLVCAAVIPLLVLACLPWRDHPMATAPAFLGIWVALLVMFTLLTSALLFGRYRSGGSLRLLVLAWAFLWSATTAVVFAAAVPGVLQARPALGSGPDQIYWIWSLRYVVTPVLLAWALGAWPRRGDAGRGEPRPPATTPHRWRLRLVVFSWIGAVATAVGLALLARGPGNPLPRIVETHADGTVALTTPAAFVVVLVNVVAVTITVAGVSSRRQRHGLEAWAVVASVAFLGDVVLSVLNQPGVTVSYYLTHFLSLVSAAFVLLALLREGSRIEAAATRDAQRLEERNAELVEAQLLRAHLAAMVSHDLRTPLAGLQGYLEILLDDSDELAAPLVRRMHERSWMLTRRMTLLTEDMLAAATLEHGGLVVSPQLLDLPTQLNECAQVFPDLDLQLSCPPGAVVEADPLRLQQVLANLVRNAQKHGAEPVAISAAVDDAGAAITVSDAGSGVPEAFVPRLFDRYSQAVASGGGSGLGLSVVRDLVEAHGGTIRYDALSNGFVFTLPRTGQAADAPHRGLRRRAALRREPPGDPGDTTVPALDPDVVRVARSA